MTQAYSTSIINTFITLYQVLSQHLASLSLRVIKEPKKLHQVSQQAKNTKRLILPIVKKSSFLSFTRPYIFFLDNESIALQASPRIKKIKPKDLHHTKSIECTKQLPYSSLPEPLVRKRNTSFREIGYLMEPTRRYVQN